jgi:hypothetical protein
MADEAPVATLETTPKAGPALSATSDFVAPVETQEAPASDTVDTKAEAGDVDATEGGESASGEETKVAKPDLTPPGVKREITKARNAERAAKEQAARLETQLGQALKALDEAAGKKAQERSADPRPSRDAFDSPDAYDDALIDWSGRQAAARAVAEDRAKQAQGEQAARAKAIKDSWYERRADFMADHADYEELAEADDLQISQVMSLAIMEADDGPALAYHLGQNPDEAARIARLSPAQAVVELGRISARLTAKPAAQTRTRPNPITPVGNRTAPNGKDPDSMSTEEYAASIAKRLPYGQRAAH